MESACRGKLECLIYEMLIIKDKRPTLIRKRTPAIQKILFNCSLFIFTFKLHALFALPFSINITTSPVNFLSFDNDGMKLSKRQVSFISLILF